MFNRPDVTAEVMEALRQVRPRHLFVAADGPRPGAADDPELCRRTREIAAHPDWKCEVSTLFQNDNLGCGRGASTALSWFFDQVEAGILLEDDCCPSRSFFDFSAYFLEKYRDEERVGSIGGNFFLPPTVRMEQPYYFSKYLQCWGWATWRRTWQHYRYDLSFLPQDEWDRICRENASTRVEEEYWRFATRALAKGIVDTWDYQLVLICWRQNQVHLAPSRNLVRNLGFRPDATNTAQPSPLAHLTAEEISDYRREVELELQPGIDSLTFYVRFLDSLTSPFFLQQAVALDEHVKWVGDQYRNIEQGVAAVNGLVAQSQHAPSMQRFEKFASDFRRASEKLTAAQERVLASNQRLAEALRELDRLKGTLAELTVDGSDEPAVPLPLRMLLSNAIGGLWKGLRGFENLVHRD
ncbi:MAG TPA: hypothetical protein VGD78_11955 [Chthoniobacterales bacterium]